MSIQGKKVTLLPNEAKTATLQEETYRLWYPHNNKYEELTPDDAFIVLEGGTVDWVYYDKVGGWWQYLA